MNSNRVKESSGVGRKEWAIDACENGFGVHVIGWKPTREVRTDMVWPGMKSDMLACGRGSWAITMRIYVVVYALQARGLDHIVKSLVRVSLGLGVWLDSLLVVLFLWENKLFCCDIGRKGDDGDAKAGQGAPEHVSC